MEDAFLGAREMGWFAARQPGVVRFLELRCGGGDAFAVGLEAAWRIWRELEARDGVPPARVPSSLLDRAEAAVAAEALLGAAVDGIAHRQPELCAYIADLVEDPPLPLDAREASALGTALAAFVYALDELTTGRPIP